MDDLKDKTIPKEQKYLQTFFQSQGILNYSCKNTVKLFQFAAVHCKTSNDSNPLHKQWCHEITYVYNGEGEVFHNDMRFKIKSGQVHICFENDNHRIVPSKNSPLRFYCIGFTLDKSNPLSEAISKVITKTNLTKSAVLSNKTTLQPAFQSIYNALHNTQSSEFSNAVITNTLNYIITDVLNDFLSEEKVHPYNISMKENLLFYIIGYLKNNLYNIDALKGLANETGYSYSYLSHLFSEKMGQSLRNFFISLRMDKAKELLKKRTVTQVAETLGYSSIHAFTRAYKSACNELPGSKKETE